MDESQSQPSAKIEKSRQRNLDCFETLALSMSMDNMAAANLADLQEQRRILQAKPSQTAAIKAAIADLTVKIDELTARTTDDRESTSNAPAIAVELQQLLDRAREADLAGRWKTALRFGHHAMSIVSLNETALQGSQLQADIIDLYEDFQKRFEAALDAIGNINLLVALIDEWEYESSLGEQYNVVFKVSQATARARLMPLSEALKLAKKHFAKLCNDEVLALTNAVYEQVKLNQLLDAEKISQRRFEIPGMFGPSAILEAEAIAELMKPLDELIDQINKRKEGWRKADNHLTTARHFLNTENYRAAQEAYWKAVDADPRHPGLEDVRQSLQRYVVLLLRRVLDKLRVAESRQDWGEVSVALAQADDILRVHNESVVTAPPPNSAPQGKV